jgi:PDZ domain-containing protein
MPRWLRRSTWSAGLLMALLGSYIVAMSLISSGFVAYKPGSATPAEDRVEVTKGATVYPPTGDILFLTVSVDRMSKLEKWWLDHNDDVEMVKESDAFPKGHKDTTQFNAQLMTQSKSTAELVALKYLGYDVFDATGASILSVVDGAPAQGHVRAGETIVAINGTAVSTATGATSFLRTTTPGQSITLRVESDQGQTRDETVVLGTRPDGQAHGYMGVGLDDRIDQKDPLPIEMSIDSGRVGGDSAGLAFTLSIIDELTPGELTGGHRIAVTGTMQIDGTVGAIGGVQQKVVAARKAKAELMLVPVDNYDEAVAKAGTSIKVLAVKDLAAALAALTDFGGNADQLALGSKTPAN